MRDAELELEAELEELISSLPEGELEAEAERFGPVIPAIANEARLYRDQWVVGFQLGRGIFDENRLTDAVFFDRHPERNGRRLTASETAQRIEWIQIRDQVVRPILHGGSPTPHPSPSGPVRPQTASWVQTLLPLLEKYRSPIVPTTNRYAGEIPLYFLLGWIQVESAGRLEETTSLNELGYFQVHPDESRMLKLDHPRLGTDSEYSVFGGIQLLRFNASQAQSRGFPAGTELLWRATKWRHWAPALADIIVKDMRANGVDPTTSWSAIEQHVTSNRNRLNDMIRAQYHIPPDRSLGGWDVVVGINNVNKTIAAGKALAAGIGSP